MALQVREKKRECIRTLSSLVAHVIGYGMAAVARHTVYAAIAHLTVHALLYLAGCTVFAWYNKRRCPQYCSCSDASDRLYSVRLTCPDGTVLQVRRAWQGTVLDIAVDLSALPYLLCLMPGPLPSGHPLVGHSWSVPTMPIEEEL